MPPAPVVVVQGKDMSTYLLINVTAGQPAVLDGCQTTCATASCTYAWWGARSAVAACAGSALLLAAALCSARRACSASDMLLLQPSSSPATAARRALSKRARSLRVWCQVCRVRQLCDLQRHINQPRVLAADGPGPGH